MMRLAFLMLLVAVSAAATHDNWISREDLYDPLSLQWCCNEHDCVDLTEAGIAVVEQSTTYLITDNGETVSKTRVLWRSPNGHWWRCAYPMTDLNGKSRLYTRCLIGPPSSF